MDWLFAVSDIKQALNLNGFDAYQAQMKMTPASRAIRRPASRSGTARLGGVLLLLYYKYDELHFVLTRRRDDLNSHAGQMSFPGGQREDGESLLLTALRETEEEIGITSNKLEVLGQLTTLYIPPSDFEVHPYVAWCKNNLQPEFLPNPDEVAEIIETPLRSYFDPEIRGEEPRDFRGHSITVPFYYAGKYKVWGATAMMISEFVERLRVVSSETTARKVI